MTIRNLEGFFKPRSVAVIGASDRARSVGNTLLANLMQGGFKGQILPVNPRHRSLCGLPVHASVADLTITRDLAVMCTPPPTVPGLIADLAARSTRAAIVITAGLTALTDVGGSTVKQQMLAAARPCLLRISVRTALDCSCR